MLIKVEGLEIYEEEIPLCPKCHLILDPMTDEDLRLLKKIYRDNYVYNKKDDKIHTCVCGTKYRFRYLKSPKPGVFCEEGYEFINYHVGGHRNSDY